MTETERTRNVAHPTIAANTIPENILEQKPYAPALADRLAEHEYPRRSPVTMAATLLRLVAAGALAGCVASAAEPAQPPERIVVPPPSATQYASAPTGLRALGLGGTRDGRLYVPASYDPAHPTPLIILLHGATQSSAMWFGSFGQRAEALHTIVLAPDSRARTWDFVLEGFGPDVAFINHALAVVCARYNVDRRRIALAGFSDGASYALTLGLANGDVTPNVVAFSPGFILSTPHRGTPAFFVSHGTADQILEIDDASRRLVPALRRAGYGVEYHEFDGRHTVPPAIADTAMQWLAKRWSVVPAGAR
jgi:phospholipase/carboxylesterase